MKSEYRYRDNPLVVWTVRVSILFDLKAVPGDLLFDWDNRSEAFGRFIGAAANFFNPPRTGLVSHLPLIGIEWELSWEDYTPNPPRVLPTALVYFVLAFEKSEEQ